MCPPNDGIEDTEYFWLLCSSLVVPRRDLLAGIFALLRPFGLTDLQNNVLTQILLFGDENFPDELNKNILLLTLYNLFTNLVDLSRKFRTAFYATQP